MAEEFLQSNIVIATKFTRPETGELKTIHNALASIEKKLISLTTKTWKIKLELDDADLKKYNFKLQQVSTGKATGPTPAPAPTRPSPPPPPTGPRPQPGTPSFGGPISGATTSRRVTEVFKEVEGVVTQTSLERQAKRQEIIRGTLRTETAITDEIKNSSKATLEEVNLLKQAQTLEEKRRVGAGIKARIQQQQERFAESGREIGEARGRGVVTRPSEWAFQSIQASERAAIETRKVSDAARLKEIEAAQKMDVVIATDHVKAERIKREQDIRIAEETDSIIAGGHKKATLKSVDEEAAARKRAETREARAYAKQGIGAAEAGQRRTSARMAAHDLEGEGFTRGPSTRKYDTVTNQMTEIHNLTKVTGDAWHGYTVEIAKADEATGKMTITTLRGSAAMRFLGDSIVRSIAKVALWTIATSAVYGTIAAFRAAGLAVVDLEEQIAFLARVSGAFAGGGASFEDRYTSAKKLTNQILDMTEAYGGNAAAALEAAAVFGRAGKTEQEVLAGVEASLIAARVAELDLVEAARLMSSAMVQFNLQANQLLPTLDSLNTLSNNYQVTTEDLLQAISRTGSVFAEHNGRLTELAALTAVISKATSRSGSEIGNAIKTISSNLDRLDVQKSVMSQLGVSVIDLEGNSKSLSQVLLELRGTIDKLGTAQQKQLLIQIAGVRQANILIAAIKGIDEAVVAENKALTEAGSAISEARDRSFTLTATLQRLSATLVKMAYDAGAPLVRMAAEVLNIVQVLLRLVDAFQGIPLMVATSIGVWYALSRALAFASVQLRLLSNEAIIWMVRQRMLTVETVRYAVANRFLAVGLAVTASATRLAAGAFNIMMIGVRGLLSPVGLATAGILALAYVMGEAATASNAYDESLKAHQQELQGAITLEEQRRQAIQNTVNAISHLIKRQEEFTAAGEDAKAEQAGAMIERQASSAGLPVGRGASIEEVVEAGQKVKRESLEKEKGKREQLMAARQQEIHKAQDKLREAQTPIGRTDTGEYWEQFKAGARVAGTYIRKGGRGGIAGAKEDVQAQYLEAEAKARRELNKLMEEQEKDQKAITEAEEKLARTIANEVPLREAHAAVIKSMLGMGEYELSIADQKYKLSLKEGDAYVNVLEIDRDITVETQRQLAELNHLLDVAENIGEAEQLFEQHASRVTKLLEDQVKSQEDLNALIMKSSKASFGTMFGVRERLYGGLAETTSEKERGLSTTASSYGAGLAKIDVQRQQQLERIRANQEAQEAIAASGMSAPAQAGALNAAKLDTEEAMVKMRELEVDAALALWEAEKDIAIERKKSADEAARALGTLSDEDKLRVRAQAAYFARNPTKKFTFEEQLNMGADTARIGQQFFGGRFEAFSEAKGAWADAFRTGGLGMTPELAKGEAEVGAARRGRTDADILRGAATGAGTWEDRRRDLMGAAGGSLNLRGFGAGPLGPGGGRGVDITGKAKNEFEVGLREGTFDFTPLTDAFKETVEASLQVAIDQMAAEVNEVKRQLMALKARAIPKTAAGTP